MIAYLYSNSKKKDLDTFHLLLNSLHPCIKNTIDKHRRQISFFDTLIINNNGKVETDIYYKPRDSKQYVLYASCHPKHTRNRIPYNLTRRLRLIISENNTQIKSLEELRNFLLKQKYPPALIENSINKVKCLNRQAILKTHENNDKDNSLIAYVTTFNPHNEEINSEIFKDKSFLLRDNKLTSIYNKTLVFDILGQVWYLIVSIPDLCTLTYFSRWYTIAITRF